MGRGRQRFVLLCDSGFRGFPKIRGCWDPLILGNYHLGSRVTGLAFRTKGLELLRYLPTPQKLKPRPLHSSGVYPTTFSCRLCYMPLGRNATLVSPGNHLFSFLSPFFSPCLPLCPPRGLPTGREPDGLTCASAKGAHCFFLSTMFCPHSCNQKSHQSMFTNSCPDHQAKTF